jgi:hypothetical protein
MELNKEQKDLILRRDDIITKRFSIPKSIKSLSEMKRLSNELFFINKQLGI